jgi:hypothetical protein
MIGAGFKQAAQESLVTYVSLRPPLAYPFQIFGGIQIEQQLFRIGWPIDNPAWMRSNN